MRRKPVLRVFGLYLVVLAIVLYAAFPLYYAVITSLKSGSALFRVDYFPFSFYR